MPKKPYVFIGSSAEGLPVAEAIQYNLDHDCECHIWSQGMFGLSGGTLETLVKRLDDFDFAILCLTPDDLTSSRGQEHKSPRDNVIFELGLFIGGISRERVFVVVDRDARAKLPSDLAGIAPADYTQPQLGNWRSAVGAACTSIKDAMRASGLRRRQPYDLSIAPGTTHDGLLILTVTNNGNKDLPPFQLELMNPHAGTLRFFISEKSGPLLSTQQRKYTCHLRSTRDGFDLSKMFHQTRDGIEMTDTEFSEWTFRAVLDDSETILYENARYGLAIASLVREAGRVGSVLNVPGPFWHAFFDK